jgi:hypothetical protein
MWFSDEEQKILDSAKEDKQINIGRSKTFAILFCILGFFIVGFGFFRMFSNLADGSGNFSDGSLSVMTGMLYGIVYWQNYENLKFKQNVYSLLRKLSTKGDRK